MSKKATEKDHKIAELERTIEDLENRDGLDQETVNTLGEHIENALASLSNAKRIIENPERVIGDYE